MSELELIYKYHQMANKQAIDNYRAEQRRKQRKAFWREYVRKNIQPFTPSVKLNS